MGPASIELDTGVTWLVVVVGLGFGVWWFGGYGVLFCADAVSEEF